MTYANANFVTSYMVHNPNTGRSNQVPWVRLSCEEEALSFSTHTGVVARHPSLVPYLRETLTAEVVREYFSHLLEEGSSVER